MQEERAKTEGGGTGRLGETIKIVLTLLQLMRVFVSMLWRGRSGDKTLPGAVINRGGMMSGRLGAGIKV